MSTADDSKSQRLNLEDEFMEIALKDLTVLCVVGVVWMLCNALAVICATTD